MCGGRGWVYCPTCKGNGMIPMLAGSVKCDNCGGSGRLPCNGCGGKGQA
ncbi:MAG: hypothetical protein H5T73_06550 [Actinobacteria bacterium]|nr:hypothetical protein [Actinomycetota bacterium]